MLTVCQSTKINTMLAFSMPFNEFSGSYRYCLHNLPPSFPFFYLHCQQQFSPRASPRWYSHPQCACSNPSDLEIRSNSSLLAELLTHPAATGPHLTCLALFSTAPTPPPHCPAWITVGCLEIFHNLPQSSCSRNLTCLKDAHLRKDACPLAHLCMHNHIHTSLHS